MAAVIAVAFLKDKTVGEALVEVVLPFLALLTIPYICLFFSTSTIFG